MGDEQPEPPTPLAYHDGRVPNYGREDVGVLATILAAIALAFAAVPWALMLLVRVPYGRGGGMACLVFPSRGVAVLFLLLSVTSERRGLPWLTGAAVALIVVFWIVVAIGVLR